MLDVFQNAPRGKKKHTKNDIKKILCGKMVKKIPPFSFNLKMRIDHSLSFLIIFFPKQYLNCSVNLHVAISKYI